MDILNLDGPEEGPEKWFVLSGMGKGMTLLPAENNAPPETGVGLLMHYASPGYGDTFRIWCERQGIKKPGESQPNQGREADYYKAIGKFYIRDWRGIQKGGQALPCTPETVSETFRRRGDFLRAVLETIGNEESFFGSNGTKPI